MPAVYIDTIVHATEDTDRIISSLAQTLGVDASAFSITRTEGHYRNPILLVSTTLQRRRADSFLEMLRRQLHTSDLEEIAATLDSRIDCSTIYLRFSKQEMLRGKLSLQDAAAVRVRIVVPAYDGQPDRVFCDALGINSTSPINHRE